MCPAIAGGIADRAGHGAGQCAVVPVKGGADFRAVFRGRSTCGLPRTIADKLAKYWGQPVIVDSKPGASGFIAIEAVKGAVPDGHELLVVSNSHVAINPSLYKKLPYDPQRDFVPVAMLYHTPFFLAVGASGPYKDVAGLIAAAKAKPAPFPTARRTSAARRIWAAPSSSSSPARR
jgi:tripartite-type tricarboxylate transporter receptor subunit TctC